MAMKTFRITYIKHGTVCNYNMEETVRATNDKIALRKFFNHKTFGDKRTRRDWMEYDKEANGITYTDFKVTEIKDGSNIRII